MGRAQRQLGILLLALAAFALPARALDRQLQIAPTKPAPSGERRIALVIGNSAYKTSPLRNPVNDARAISKALAATGFKVTVVEDGSLTTMRRAVRSFGDDLAAGGVGLFYYAGHGMQVRGKNYLIPVNADIEREDEVEDGALDANFVLAKMDSAKNALNLMILDACRNNPFARSFRSAAQGLAQMDAPSGTLVAFATAPGSVASDGDGANGLYTKYLLANIARPGLPIEQVFKEVRRGVGRETADRQIPWESSSLRGDFFFVAPDASTTSEAQKLQMERAIADAVKREQDKLAIERAQQQAQMQKLIQDMLAKQRAEMEEELRRQRGEAAKPAAVAAAPSAVDREAMFWDSIKTSSNPEDYRAYLAQYPQGAFAALARLRAGPSTQQAARPIEQLKPAAPVAAAPAAAQSAPARPAPTQMASAAPASMAGFGIDDPRYPRIGDSWEYQWIDTLSRRKVVASYTISGVSREGILEVGGLGSAETMRAYSAGPQIVFDNVWDLNPYLLSFGPLSASMRWRNPPIAKNLSMCGRPGISCAYTAHVAGTEKVTVPAGTFDATKVIVEMLIGGSGFGAGTTREITFWYALDAKRHVKATVRTRGGNSMLPDYDFELTRFIPAQAEDPGKPVQVAGIAPSGLAGQDPAYPKVGDRWEYAYLDTSTQRTQSVSIEAGTVSRDALVDLVKIGAKDAVRKRQDKAARLAFNSLWLEFSPYLLAIDPPKEGQVWRDIPSDFPNCQRASFTCRIEGRVVGREKVKTAAGEFDALKVVLEYEQIPFGSLASVSPRAWRQITFWYSESAKRLVKTTMRTTSGMSLEADYDVELVSYKLN